MQQRAIPSLQEKTAEDAVIKAAREGDLAAFDRLLSLFSGRIYGYLYRVLGNREDAEDVVQEVFIKVFKNFTSYNPEQSFKTWLFTIATNTAFDFLRKKKVRPESFILSDPENPFETVDEADTYLDIESSHDIQKALATLKPAYRTVLLLFYKDDLSVEEVANVLKVPEGTVKTHLYRARKALKVALESYD